MKTGAQYCRQGSVLLFSLRFSMLGLLFSVIGLAACLDQETVTNLESTEEDQALSGAAGAAPFQAEPASLDPSSESFDHFLTGFPLEGAHAVVGCEGCHSSADFRQSSTRCADCHNGISAIGQDPDHFVTNLACENCHDPANSWIRVRFSHNSPNYPGDHRGNLDCLECHLTNNQIPIFDFPQFAPDCAGCHADDFEDDEHDQNLVELRDCGGACHDDDDDDDFEFRVHRVTDSEFDD